MKTGQFALITGASSRIGKNFAEIFASKGHNLILIARSKDRLDQISKILTQKFNIQAVVIQGGPE
jgi:short-subunit dehydrogenase